MKNNFSGGNLRVGRRRREAWRREKRGRGLHLLMGSGGRLCGSLTNLRKIKMTATPHQKKKILENQIPGRNSKKEGATPTGEGS